MRLMAASICAGEASNWPLMAGATMAVIFLFGSARHLWTSMILERCDGSVGTCLHTLAAVDALLLVDMFRTVRLFGDGLDGARLFARDGRIDDGVVGTYLLTESAAHAVLLRDGRLAALERDGAFGTVHHARTGFAAAAHVGDEVLRLHAGVARFVHHGEDILLHVLVVQ